MIFGNYAKWMAGSLVLATLFTACNNSSQSDTTAAAKDSAVIKEEDITFTGDNATMKGFVAYNDDTSKGKRPAVLVIPEWWGLNDYPKMRAKMLAQLGYVAMAVDLYGDGKVADNPDSAGAWAGPFYKD